MASNADSSISSADNSSLSSSDDDSLSESNDVLDTNPKNIIKKKNL